MEVREAKARYLKSSSMWDSSVPAGYKRTEIGLIPEDWAAVRLAEIGEPLIGLTYRPSDVAQDGVLVLRSSNVQNGVLRFDDNVFVTCEVPKRIMVRLGDILICVRNGSRNLIGKCALVDEQALGMTFGAFMAIFRTDASKFIFQQFGSPLIQRQIHEHLGATINQITNASLKSFVAALPPTETEQEAIAEALGDADALIESLEQLIAKKRQIKQGTMQALLTGKQRLPGFEKAWDDRVLGDVVDDLEAGVSVNSTKDEPSQEVPCVLKTSAISGGRFISSQCKVIAHRDWQRTRVGVVRNTILISRMNTPDLVGEVAYVDADYPMLFLPDRVWMARFRPELDIDVTWLGYVLSSSDYSRRIKASATGTSGSMKNISKPALLSIEIALPCVEEQTAIATILTDMDTELVELETRLAKTRQLKQGMMQELLTGRIRLV